VQESTDRRGRSGRAAEIVQEEILSTVQTAGDGDVTASGDKVAEVGPPVVGTVELWLGCWAEKLKSDGQFKNLADCQRAVALRRANGGQCGGQARFVRVIQVPGCVILPFLSQKPEIDFSVAKGSMYAIL
jgi:hypothetical protein